jgi:hypothetical protein
MVRSIHMRIFCNGIAEMQEAAAQLPNRVRPGKSSNPRQRLVSPLRWHPNGAERAYAPPTSRHYLVRMSGRRHDKHNDASRVMLLHMRTTVDLPDALHSKAIRVAKASHSSLRDLIEEGLRSVLRLREQAPAAQKLEDCSFGGSGTLPGIDITNWDQIRDVINEGR